MSEWDVVSAGLSESPPKTIRAIKWRLGSGPARPEEVAYEELDTANPAEPYFITFDPNIGESGEYCFGDFSEPTRLVHVHVRLVGFGWYASFNERAFVGPAEYHEEWPSALIALAERGKRASTEDVYNAMLGKRWGIIFAANATAAGWLAGHRDWVADQVLWRSHKLMVDGAREKCGVVPAVAS